MVHTRSSLESLDLTVRTPETPETKASVQLWTKKGVLSLNKKDDASNSVFRFEAALTAVETEFVSLSVQSFLGDMKAAVKVKPK